MYESLNMIVHETLPKTRTMLVERIARKKANAMNARSKFKSFFLNLIKHSHDLNSCENHSK